MRQVALRTTLFCICSILIVSTVAVVSQEKPTVNAAGTPSPPDASPRELRARLHRIAAEVVESAKVAPGEKIPGWTNTTGVTLRLPGGNRGYPAFWVRDAAMMLGADFIKADEVEGWIRLIAGVQNGPQTLTLKHGLSIPPYSIPDHITLNGAACWYPGAMDGDDQGNGSFGFLPPADDAFYVVQMAAEHRRLTRKADLFTHVFHTRFGDVPLWEICEKAFDSVDADATGLVVCSSEAGKTRVDWGFCDTVRKTGACLMPSLLRWRAARDLEALFRASGKPDKAERYATIARRIRPALIKAFSVAGADRPSLLISATGIGKQEDVWASAYAVWLGVLPARVQLGVCTRLRELASDGGTVLDGQVRCLPKGQFWEQCLAGQGTYQNGAYWGTPTGWFIAAVARADRDAARKMLSEFLTHLQTNKAKGAPWECFNPALNHYQNPLYCATVALPFVALNGLSL